MADRMHIRDATPQDVPKIINLYQHLSPEDTPCPTSVASENFAQFQRLAGSAILLGDVGGIVVTSCVLVVIPNLSRMGHPYALIENVVTCTDYRNKGYGKQILNAACARAWAQDCYKVMLMTGSKRPSTLQFYEDVGFAQTKIGFQKRRPGF